MAEIAQYVLDRIRQARDSEAIKLDLIQGELTVLPESMRQLTKLTTLDMRGNHLTILPDWIGQLTNLTSLDVSGNQLLVRSNRK